MLKIELRKVQHAKSLSEETPAYSAQVWIDGVHVCDVSNHGQGGPDMHHPPRGAKFNNAELHGMLARYEARIAAEYPKSSFVAGGKTHTLDATLEGICHEQLGDLEVTASLQRMLKRTIAFYDPARKGVFTYKGKPLGVQRAHLCTETVRKYPNAKVLNNLPFAEALAIFKSAAVS